MNSATVTVQGVTAHPGTSKKTGKPYTRYEIATSGGSFSTFDSALELDARNALNMTAAVTYEETQYGKDLKSLTVDPTATPQPHVEAPPAVKQDGSADWDLIGLRKTRCALWVAAIGAGLNTHEAAAAVLAAEVDIFHRQPATATSDLPF